MPTLICNVLISTDLRLFSVNTNGTMRLITVQPPWSFAIRFMGMDLLNVPVESIDHYRRFFLQEEIAIHACIEQRPVHQRYKTLCREIIDKHGCPSPWKRFDPAIRAAGIRDVLSVREMVRFGGGIFAVATFGGMVDNSPSRWFTGPFAVRLLEIRLLPEMLPHLGQLLPDKNEVLKISEQLRDPVGRLDVIKDD